MDHDQLQEFLDACRPGSDDLQRPEMEPLRRLIETDPDVRRQWEAAQAWERNLQQLCRDVPVPPGLEARILERLEWANPAVGVETAQTNHISDRPEATEAAGSVNAADSHLVQAGQDDAAESPVGLDRSRKSMVRRGWIVAVTTAACALLIYRFAFWSPPVRSDDLAQNAVVWSTSKLDASGWSNDWNALGDAELRPMSQQVAATQRAWQRVAVDLDPRCIAYRLNDIPFARPPVLFVMRSRAALSSKATRPPAQPDQRTGGVACGVWREGDCLYALVVPGTESDYQQLTRQAHARAETARPHLPGSLAVILSP